jgi:hypothetical protein
VAGCGELPASGRCACKTHFAELPVAEQVRWFESMEAASIAPDMQRARLEARLRVGAVLRGVRA